MGTDTSIIFCLEDHKYQPKNYWNGKWRSQWTYTIASGAGEGLMRVQVHYYEDGNVQLRSQRSATVEVPLEDEAATAKKFFKKVAEVETQYQTAISENYSEMSHTTFKALRRQLPVTRQKVDWDKIANYKVGR